MTFTEILDGTNELLNKDQNEQAVTDLQGSMRSLRQILQNVESAGIDETIKSANTVLVNLKQTRTRIDGVLHAKPSASGKHHSGDK